MTFSTKILKQAPLNQWLVVLWLLFILFVAGIPGYFTGNWEWKQSAPIVNLKQIQQLGTQGLDIPDWKTLEQKELPVGGHKWSWQEIQKQNSNLKATLLLYPQGSPKSYPQVEWTDIKSLAKWEVAQYRLASFNIPQSNISKTNRDIKVKARFFRATLKNQNSRTYAVLQWYAMPTKGSPSPLDWFLADQAAKLHKQRVPWVAVNIMLPIESLGQIENSWSEMKSLGKTVQASLTANIFANKG
ncbi:MAG: cyanoexosortase B system-associated protein [Cyanobacteria bacterium P01_A01_bin.84]